MDTGIRKRWSAATLLFGVLIGLVFIINAEAADITVSGTTDAVGTCDDSGSPVVCTSLRAAVIYANANAGSDTITLGTNEYILSLAGVDETWSGTGTEGDPYVASITPDATQGDLDITESLTITGTLAGADSDQLATTIRWDSKSVTDPAVGDRIFHIQAPVGGTAVNVTISNLILRDGSVGVAPNTNCSDTTNPYDIEIIPGDLCKIWQFRRMGGAVAIGAGAAVVLYEEAIHGPVDGGGGGGSGVPRGPFPGGKPGGEEPEAGVIEHVTLDKVAIIGNMSGADGGGIYSAAPSTLTQSVLSGNTGGANGGGIYNDAVMTINETTIGKATSIPFLADAIVAEASLLSTGNSAEGGGGLFDTGTHTTTITSSTFYGNNATGGAGIGARSLVVFDITNTTITGNSAFDVGGGITTNGVANLTNSTVAFNDASSDAPGGGGGLNSFGQGTFNLLNTIVSNNSRNGVDSNCGCSGGAATCAPGRIVSRGYNIENAGTCELSQNSDFSDTDPLLVALAANGGLTETHAVPHTANGDGANSPAVDHGNDSECPNSDQRGSIRPFDGNLDFVSHCDIGAYELFIATNDLHINNMSGPDKVNKGDTVNVTVEIHNPTGQVNGIDNVAATSVVLTATVDAALTGPAATFIKTGGVSTPCSVAANKVTCSVGTLDLDDTATMSLSATAAATGQYEISAAVTSESKDLIPNNNADSIHVAVAGFADLELGGSAASQSVDLGDPLSVTYTVTNTGGGDAAVNTRLGVSYTEQVTFNSTSSSGVTCAANDGEVSCDLGDLANLASTTVTLLFDTAKAGKAELTANVVSDANDNDSTNNGVDLSATVVANSDLAVTLSVDDDSVTKGKDVTATVKVSNKGPDAATNATLNVTLPSGWTWLSTTASSGTCTAASGTVTCTWDSLDNGDSATITIVASADTKGTSSISASLSADQNDPDASNNSASLGTKVKKSKNAFGCSATDNATVDPTLPAMLLLSLVGLVTRRRLLAE